MSKTIERGELQIVVQFGGSSGEHYMHTFATEKEANRCIRHAYRASYDCLGPFRLLLPEVRELSEASADILKMLKADGWRNKAPKASLAKALAQVQRTMNVG